MQAKIRTVEGGAWTVAGKPSKWSAPERRNVWPLGEMWVSHREREMETHATVTTVYNDCAPGCPVGYFQPEGKAYCARGSTLGARPDGTFEDQMPPYTPMIHVVYQLRASTSDTVINRWRETEYRTWLKNPYYGRLEDLTNAAWATPATAGRHISQLPPLPYGEQLVLGTRHSTHRLSIDGTEHKPQRAIVADKLGLGFHLVELFEDVPSQGRVTLQLPLSVIAPLDVRVQPMNEILLSEKQNGGVVAVTIINQSRSEHCFHATIASTPPGWMAVTVDKPLRVLKPGRQVTVRVQIERMVETIDDPDLPAPFGLQIALLGRPNTYLNTTFYAAARKSRTRRYASASTRG